MLVFLSCEPAGIQDKTKEESRSGDTTLSLNPDIPDSAVIKKPENSSSFHLEVYKSDGGWGYKIFKEGKLLIDQPHIPAINGLKTFSTEKDAEKSGSLMMNKLEKNIMPPSISKRELDSLRIKY